MVTKENLVIAPEWIQWRLIEDSVNSVEWVLSLNSAITSNLLLKFHDFVPSYFPRILGSIAENIMENADCSLTNDPPKRVSIRATAEEW